MQARLGAYEGDVIGHPLIYLRNGHGSILVHIEGERADDKHGRKGHVLADVEIGVVHGKRAVSENDVQQERTLVVVVVRCSCHNGPLDHGEPAVEEIGVEVVGVACRK